jgi:hypothetical protein
VVGTIVMVIVGIALFWNFGSIALRLVAWVLAAFAVFSVFADIDVPGGAMVLAACAWLVGHGLFRLRNGYWRSRLLGAVAA